jgi:hypothetical protein
VRETRLSTLLLEKVRPCARKGGENGRLGRLIEQLHEYRSNQELDLANSVIESTALVRQLLEPLNQRIPGLTRIEQALSAKPWDRTGQRVGYRSV